MERVATSTAIAVPVLALGLANPAPGQKSQKMKLLVRKLPERVEGVALRNGAVTTRPGYKFVRGGGGKVWVYQTGGGGPLGGPWGCGCADAGAQARGECRAVVSGRQLSCECEGPCGSTTTVGDEKVNVAAIGAKIETTYSTKKK